MLSVKWKLDILPKSELPNIFCLTFPFFSVRLVKEEFSIRSCLSCDADNYHNREMKWWNSGCVLTSSTSCLGNSFLAVKWRFRWSLSSWKQGLTVISHEFVWKMEARPQTQSFRGECSPAAALSFFSSGRGWCRGREFVCPGKKDFFTMGL